VIVPIDPVVVSIGPLAVRWFGVLALLGLGLGVWLTLRELDREKLARGGALDTLAWALPVGLLMGRLVFVLGWWEYFFTHQSEIWQFSIDGLSLWGAMLSGGAIAFVRLAGKRDPTRRRRMLDAIAPNLALGIAIGRLGAFLDGSGQGVPAAGLAWATQYTHPLSATPDFGVPRHPVQVYEALVALVLYVALSRWGLSRLPRAVWAGSRRPRDLPAGSRMAAFLVLFGLAWFGLGGLRLAPAFLFGLQIEQLLALVGIGAGLIYGLAPALSLPRARSPSAAGRPSGPAEDQLAA
jgi:phosphatidylglycerol:prolipoprotein diacylglycerol transferase